MSHRPGPTQDRRLPTDTEVQFEIERHPDPDALDAFVARQADWTAFHLSPWRRVIERAFGHPCEVLEAKLDGETVGVLPLVTVKSRLFGHFLVSMPFGSYGGALGSADAVVALADHAAGLAESRSADLLEMRGRRLVEAGLDVSTRKITVLLDLPDDAEVLWNGLKAKLRSQVRRPRKEGYEVRFGASEIGPFWEVFARHMRDLGTPALSRRFFEILAEELGDAVTFACVYDGDLPIAGGCTIEWGDEVEITWASSLRSYSRTAPNMLLYWSFIERAIDSGKRVFNFGRCTPDGGTHRFKKQWGGRDEQLYWLQRQGKRAKTPSPDDDGFGLAIRVWQKLPLAVTNVLGPRIVKNIP